MSRRSYTGTVYSVPLAFSAFLGRDLAWFASGHCLFRRWWEDAVRSLGDWMLDLAQLHLIRGSLSPTDLLCVSMSLTYYYITPLLVCWATCELEIAVR